MEWLLHWAYVREKVHLARAAGMGPSAHFVPRGFPGASSSERIGAAVGSSMNLGFEASADAYVVMRAVDAQRQIGRVVREYALIGSRPDWTPNPVIAVERGRTGCVIEIVKAVRRGKERRYPCEFRMVSFRGDLPEIVAERRRVYGAWALGVANVHRALAGRLTEYQMAADLPSRTPWLDANPNH